MEASTALDTVEVVLMWASQMGKTETINNVVGYHIDWHPSPILLLQPTLGMAETWSKDRGAPMIRDTPRLQGKVKDVKSRDSDNTILHKGFPGGHLTICGANAAASLSSRPIRVVICDEVDRYPASAGTEGDPVELAYKRTDTFSDAVLFLTSTPTVKGMSRIEKEFEQTDKRFFFVPCSHCQEFQTLEWSMVKYSQEDIPNAWIECKHCAAKLHDADRVSMIHRGEWRATAPFNGRRGYHLNGLYSLFDTKKGFKNKLHQFVAAFLKAEKGGQETKRVWWNTFLAQSWEEPGEVIDYHPLMARRENYGAAIPKEIVAITFGADVQGDRLECEVVGWGPGEESWALAFRQFAGRPSQPEPWEAFDRFISQTFAHPLFGQMPISAGLIDSGHATKEVYKFTRSREMRMVYACKGRGGAGVPPVSRVSRGNRSRAGLIIVGVDAVKTTLYSRLSLADPGPGYCHFLDDPHYDEVWFQQLVSERIVRRLVKGRYVRAWEKIENGLKNEALDCRVYAMAALGVLNRDLTAMGKRLAKTEGGHDNKPEMKTTPMPQQTEKRPPQAFRGRIGKGFVTNWRKF